MYLNLLFDRHYIRREPFQWVLTNVEFIALKIEARILHNVGICMVLRISLASSRYLVSYCMIICFLLCAAECLPERAFQLYQIVV